MVKKKTSSTGNSVNVVLEKAENTTKKQPVLQVDPGLLNSLKSGQQLEEERKAAELASEEKVKHDYYKNKVLYYGGLFGTVLVMWLAFRYYKTAKPTGAVLQEVVNGVVQIVPQ